MSDSDIEEPSVVVATVTKADQIASPTYPALLRRPTLVQHAAAATIQRSFRQHIAVRSKQGSMQRCRPLLEATAKSLPHCLHTSVSPTSDEQQHKAASCIQSRWRQRMAERRHVPLTPPSTYAQTAMTSSSMLFVRPDSATSSKLSGELCSTLLQHHMMQCTCLPRIIAAPCVFSFRGGTSSNVFWLACACDRVKFNAAETEHLSEGSTYDGGCRMEASTTPAGLAELRVSTAVKLRRMKSPLTLSSQAPIKGAAMLVVQRTSDRAQQVEVNASGTCRIQ